MNAEELLKALPVDYYVIDVDKKEILQTNNIGVSVGKNCFRELFNGESPCEEQNGKCICQQKTQNTGSTQFILEKEDNGQKEFFRVEVKPLKANTVLACINNITSEVTTRKEVKINTRRLGRAEKLGHFGYWEIDLTNQLMISTKGASEIYGIEKTVLPLEVAQGIPLSKYRKQLDKELEDLIAGKESYDIVFEIERPSDGEIRSIHSIAEYHEDKNMVFGVIRDITEKVKAENELNRTNTLLRTLIDNLPDAIYMKDANYRKIISNKGDARNCGFENPDELIGKTDFDIFPAETAENYAEDDRRVIENGETVLNREEELPGEPKRWILTTKIPLRDRVRNITGMVGIGHDITLYKQMNEALRFAKEKAEESDRLKSIFLANMSHEIRTPLNAILGFSNIICSEDVEKSKINYYGKIIENSGRRLTTVIDDILDISLIRSNQLRIEYSRFDVNELLGEMYFSYKTEKSEKLQEIELKVNYCPDKELSVIQSDKNRVYQVLKNLLDNAFKFTAKGCIRFGCFAANSTEIELYVKDSGVGIQKEKINSVFETFRQVDEGHTRRYEGSGLGLSIVSGIIERLGGSIRVDSEIGEGSVFRVTIPREKNNFDKSDVADELPSQKTGNEAEAPAKTGQIVSFEDDPASIGFLKSVVHLQGYKLVNFIRPKDGIEFLRNNHVDLVLMDVQLPEMNGYEATKIIKSEFPNLPVIIQTAYAMKGDREKAMLAGCDDYLTKPVSLKELKEKINRFVQKRNLN